MAGDCYVTALNKSIYLTEALDALLQHEMLRAWEERELITKIMPKDYNETDLTVLKYLYEQKLKKYYTTTATSSNVSHPEMTPSNNSQLLTTITEKIKKSEIKLASGLPSSTTVKGNVKIFNTPAVGVMSPANRILYDLKHSSTSFSIQASLSRISMLNTSRTVNSSKMTCGMVKNEKEIVTSDKALKTLEESVDVKVAKAEELFYNCEYKKCLKIINEILERDPYHKKTLFVQIGCLMELKDANGKKLLNFSMKILILIHF